MKQIILPLWMAFERICNWSGVFVGDVVGDVMQNSRCWFFQQRGNSTIQPRHYLLHGSGILIHELLKANQVCAKNLQGFLVVCECVMMPIMSMSDVCDFFPVRRVVKIFPKVEILCIGMCQQKNICVSVRIDKIFCVSVCWEKNLCIGVYRRCTLTRSLVWGYFKIKKSQKSPLDIHFHLFFWNFELPFCQTFHYNWQKFPPFSLKSWVFFSWVHKYFFPFKITTFPRCFFP